MALATPSLRPPNMAFPWNGEVRLLDVEKDEDLPKDKKSVHKAVRCCTQVLVKRLPTPLTDGASIDFNIQLSAAMENEKSLLSGVIHMLQTLTCHTKRPGDDSDHFYVVLEHCDFNLAQAVERTLEYARTLRSTSVYRSSPDEDAASKPVTGLHLNSRFDEDAAPLLLWRARRSVARQLISGVAFLHRTGMGPLRRIYHNNLKPSNILLKNGVVKLSEINCYSHSDAAEDGSLIVPLPGLTGACAAPIAKPDDMQSPRIPPPLMMEEAPPRSGVLHGESSVYEDDGLLQPEFVPALSVSDVEEMARLTALLASSKGDKSATPVPTPSANLVDTQQERLAAHQIYKIRAYRDTFAVGCLIFYALTLGKHPFGRLPRDAKKGGTAAANVMKGTPHPIKQIAASLEAAAGTAAAQARAIAASIAHEAGTGSDIPSPSSSPEHAALQLQTAVPGVLRQFVHTGPPAVESPTEPRASHTELSNGTPNDLTARATDILVSYKDVVSGRRPSLDPDFSTPLVTPMPVAAERPGSIATGSTETVPAPLQSQGSSILRAITTPLLHPSRSPNMLQHVYHMSPVDPVDYEEAADLVCSLIEADTNKRITLNEALAHPFFWSIARKFLFIQTISESVVVNQDRAAGENARFAGEIQTRFMGRMPPGATSWSNVFKPPASLGTEGWSSPKWTHKHPGDYERNYSGPYNMYSLVRFIRNFYVHGPEHIRAGVFESLSHLEAYLLSAWPWLVIELYRADQVCGGRFTAFTLAGGTDQVARLMGGGVDAEADASHVESNVAFMVGAGDTEDFAGVTPMEKRSGSPAPSSSAVSTPRPEHAPTAPKHEEAKPPRQRNFRSHRRDSFAPDGYESDVTGRRDFTTAPRTDSMEATVHRRRPSNPGAPYVAPGYIVNFAHDPHLPSSYNYMGLDEFEPSDDEHNVHSRRRVPRRIMKDLRHGRRNSRDYY